ncbi:MAG: alpha/beta hydrolase [Nitriliruptoraceae bacterium]
MRRHLEALEEHVTVVTWDQRGAGRSYAALDPTHSYTIDSAVDDTFGVLYPQLQAVDLRETATELEVPVYLVQGANEIDGRRQLLAEWYPALQAPSKRLIEFETAGHRPLFERPERFVADVADTVLPETAAGPRS